MGVYTFLKKKNFLGKTESCFYENKFTYMRIYIRVSIYMYAYRYMSVYMGVYTFFFFFWEKGLLLIFFYYFFRGMTHGFCKTYSLLGFLKTWAKDKLFV